MGPERPGRGQIIRGFVGPGEGLGFFHLWDGSLWKGVNRGIRQ